MTSESQGVMAAPNQSEIKAKVLQIDQSSQFPDKWYLELEILATKTVSGPNFAQVEHRVKAFTISLNPNLYPGNIITAQAEFVGDARGGVFRLTQVKVVESP